jgi:DUF1365 family protein
VPHAFTYPVFMTLLDISRVPELMRVSRLTSHNRWNWASFDDRDHLGDPSRPLRERNERWAGIRVGSGLRHRAGVAGCMRNCPARTPVSHSTAK